MTSDMEATLRLGFNPFGRNAPDPFLDDAHRREIWVRNRAGILGDWDGPGRRPWALWRFDFGLKRLPGYRRWTWPEPIVSETEMVYELVKSGKLASCPFNGIHQIRSELAVIEAWWASALRNRSEDPEDPVPEWFRRKHGSRIEAEEAAAGHG